ncbi:hypothetical protein BGZ93_009413 [Podila epicladia]|nr:hypothetical protein BGZ93_009413 [Podila epicladia]
MFFPARGALGMILASLHLASIENGASGLTPTIRSSAYVFLNFLVLVILVIKIAGLEFGLECLFYPRGNHQKAGLLQLGCANLGNESMRHTEVLCYLSRGCSLAKLRLDPVRPR